MFEVTGRGARRAEDHQEKEMNEGESWGLKPMNCPGHCLLFGTKARSYRDLPVRYADFSPLHRNEVTGSLSGLTRIRRFHQDDGHIFCRADQVRDEISSTLQMIELVYGVFGLQPHKLLLSTRPDSGFIGLVEEWDQAERQLQEALEASNMQWALNAGDGAFYGPKIDVILRDNQDKEHQTATIQLDFQLPGRFELKYQSRPPHLVSTGSTTEVPLSYSTPILIHRAVLGSLERFLALLIEHYAGRFPLWLSPRQIKIVTTNTSESAVAHAKIVAAMLSGQHLSRDSSGSSPEPRLQPLAQPHTSYIVDVDAEPKTIGRKVASARKDKWCVICTVGNREAETGTVAVEFTLPKESSGLLEKKRAAKLRSVVGDICGDEGAAMKSMVMSLEKLKEVLDRLCAEWL
ncbi:MAG: hypothetical protein LQ340_000366 [Diploschistes diacapsis]|nr:MAG: hypothetical protein LQ340_000366 [Diploschistes diacapsis]